ncbi:M23 family metallopeptidase, partial [Bacteroides xylanisolvens]
MRRYITALMLACCIGGYGQEKKQVTFVPPFDFPLTLSGNFGEIRSNHFHGGLDFKTGGVIGKPVRALADGYISRIRVTNGSGYVLDVCYHNGYSTINRHLSGFVSPIAERVEKLQYEEESWEVEIVPEPEEYPVKGGQQIAWSGNTGYSFGPHLHLDVFETESGDYIDPMPFFQSKIKDTRAPKADGILFFPQLGKGVVDGKQENKIILPNSERPVEAWGVIGVGIKAYDYMDGVNNHYGVYSVVLTVDGNEIFRSTVDRFSQEENRMINSWTYGQYMKSFIDPGNTLRLLKASNDNRGLVTIDEERDYQFLYTLKDAFGNTSKYSFTVRGRKQPIEPLNHREKYYFTWNKTNYLQEPGLNLVVPKGMLYD